MSYYKKAICDLCGKSVIEKNLHYHQNNYQCVVDRETKAAKEAGYARHDYVANVATAFWAKPFVKQFKTGQPKNQNGHAELRWWVKQWWWVIYRLCDRQPDRQDLLTQVFVLYNEQKFDEIDNLVAGIELAKENL